MRRGSQKWLAAARLARNCGASGVATRLAAGGAECMIESSENSGLLGRIKRALLAVKYFVT